jgi:hypothetical protein
VVSAASANGGTVVSNAGWIFYLPASGFTNSDTFNYSISDGLGAPVTGIVTVTPTPRSVRKLAPLGKTRVKSRRFWKLSFSVPARQKLWLDRVVSPTLHPKMVAPKLCQFDPISIGSQDPGLSPWGAFSVKNSGSTVKRAAGDVLRRDFGGRCFAAERYASSDRDAGVFGHYETF